MASFQTRRCVHCSARYSYQASGEGCQESTNDDRYCPPCMKVILEALSSVPPKSNRAWKATRDVSVGSLVEIEQQRLDSARAEGLIPVRRVLVGLFDMHDPSNQHEQGIVSLHNRTYRYEYWTKSGIEAGHVYVEVEEDANTGEVLGPWNLRDIWDSVPSFYEPEPEPPRPPPTFTPSPMLDVKVRRFDMIESQSLADIGPSLPSRDFLPVGRKSFLAEPLPEGALPIYDKDPEKPDSDE